MTDGDLAHFADYQQLQFLILSETAITGAGLKSLKECKALPAINLDCTLISDVGLMNFTGCEGVTNVSLVGTQVTGTGLVAFKNAKRLEALNLSKSKASDAAMESVANGSNRGHRSDDRPAKFHPVSPGCIAAACSRTLNPSRLQPVASGRNLRRACAVARVLRCIKHVRSSSTSRTGRVAISRHEFR